VDGSPRPPLDPSSSHSFSAREASNLGASPTSADAPWIRKRMVAAAVGAGEKAEGKGVHCRCSASVGYGRDGGRPRKGLKRRNKAG